MSSVCYYDETKFFVRLHGEYNASLASVETPRKFIIAKRSNSKDFPTAWLEAWKYFFRNLFWINSILRFLKS